MNLIQRPTKGTQFVLHDTEYEIQHLNGQLLRYSSVIGGKTFTLPVEQYQALLAATVITVTHEAKTLLHEGNIKEVARKMKYVNAILAYSGSCLKKGWVQNTINRLAEEMKDTLAPSYHTARRWIQKYREHGQDALIPQVNGNSAPRFDAETDMIVAEEIEAASKRGFAIIGVEVHASVVNRLYSRASERDEYEVKIPSVRLIQRRISQLDHYYRLVAKHGKEKANRLTRASGKKIIVPCPMSVVQIDTHYLNVIVIDPDTFEPLGRPYLALAKCIHTRRIVGHYISLFPPSATTTLQAVKVMLEFFGCPGIIIPDRGVEFMNSALFHLCNHLLTTLEVSQVREPNHKANVESFFKTISNYLIERLDGTTYSNVLARGNYDPMGSAIFTLDQVKLYVDCWINEVYDIKPHSQTKRAPIAMWEAAIAGVPLLKLESNQIESFARIPVIKTVNSGQVEPHPELKYYSHALTEFNGRKVTVLVDELDLNNVYVRHPDDSTILIKATSKNESYTAGLTLNQHQLAREELNDLSAAEMAIIGEHKWQIGLARLMDRIRDDAISNKKKKKATNGMSLADTTIYEKIRDIKSTNEELEKKQKRKNQPKTSSTRTMAYVDNSEHDLKSGEVVEYDVIEI